MDYAGLHSPALQPNDGEPVEQAVPGALNDPNIANAASVVVELQVKNPSTVERLSSKAKLPW